MKNSKTKKQRILNAEQIKVILERFAREIPRQYPSLEPVVFIGIRTRGPHMAKRVAEIMKKQKCLLILVFYFCFQTSIL